MKVPQCVQCRRQCTHCLIMDLHDRANVKTKLDQLTNINAAIDMILDQNLEKCGGNQTKAARLSGIPERTWYRWMKRRKKNLGSVR